MYGLEAISSANGWVMAITGGAIVMTGLTVLSFIISQLPKAVAYMEKRQQEKSEAQTRAAGEATASEADEPLSLDLDELTCCFKPIVEELGDSFELKALYVKCKDSDLPHAHLSIRTLRQAGKLVSQGDGVFTWNKS